MESAFPLDRVTADMASAVIVLHSGPIPGTKHHLRLETAREHHTPDLVAQALCSALEELSPTGRKQWDRARRKEFNVGCELQSGMRAVEISLTPETLKRITALGATIGFTCYLP